MSSIETLAVLNATVNTASLHQTGVAFVRGHGIERLVGEGLLQQKTWRS